MTITPLAPREPYALVAAASLRTSIWSMSPGAPARRREGDDQPAAVSVHEISSPVSRAALQVRGRGGGRSPFARSARYLNRLAAVLGAGPADPRCVPATRGPGWCRAPATIRVCRIPAPAPRFKPHGLARVRRLPLPLPLPRGPRARARELDRRAYRLLRPARLPHGPPPGRPYHVSPAHGSRGAPRQPRSSLRTLRLRGEREHPAGSGGGLG